MAFVLLSSLANYAELHHDKALQSAIQGKAASHLSNAFNMGYFEELPLSGQYKQEAFWRDYAVLVKYHLGRIRLQGQHLNMVLTFIKATITRSGSHNHQSRV